MRNIISKFLFTLLALTLGFGQMWGADAEPDTTILFGTGSGTPTYGDYINKSYDISTGISVSLNHYVASGAAGTSFGGNNGGYGYISFGSSANIFDQHNFRISASGTTIDSIAFLITSNGSSAANPAVAVWIGAFNAGNSHVVFPLGETNTAKTYAGSEWKKVNVSAYNSVIVGITRKVSTSMKAQNISLSAQVGNSQNFRLFGVKIWLHPAAATAPAITAPTTDQSATYTVGDAITALEVTATGSPAPTYQWYSNTSASTTGATSLGSGAQTASYTPDNSVASDLYYYCVATNSAGSATSPYFHITINTPSTPTHGISYTNTKGADMSAYPTEYYEGIGVASFEPLADVADFHFTEWSPASIANDATTDQVIDAQWVAAYNVTFALGGATGTAPDAFQKWEGATFNLPGQGSMVAPDGKAFDGWKANGAGAKLAANAEYTMTAADVEFVAQWKATPTVLFHWRSNTGTTTTDATNGTTTGGTTTLRTTDSGKSWGNESATYDASVAADMQGETSGKELKSGGNALYLELSLSSGTFQEGDTVFVTGYNPWIVSTSTTFDPFDATDSIFTGSSKTDVKTGYAIVKSGVNSAKLYVRRGRGSGSAIAAIKVIRPAAREIASTVITLSDVKVNDHSISSDSLDMLKVGPAYSLTLKDSYAAAPEIKFNEHTVITYVEGLPATKETDKVYTVTATEVAGNWQAQQTINAITYIVNATKVSAATVSYYDGATKLGEEIVAVGGNPADYATYQTKQLATFDGWYNDPDLAVGHEIADIAALTVDADMNVYGKWTNRYASSVNIEQWTLDNGKGGTDAEKETQTGALVSLLGTRGFASNIAYEKGNIELDSLNDDPSKTNRNYAYLGLKVKSAGKMLDLRLANSSVLRVKFGNVGTTPKVSINGAAYEDMTITDNVYTYTAIGDDYVSIKTADGKAVVFQQIMIDEPIAPVALPWKVTFDAATNGGTCTTESLSGTSVTLPDATPASGFTFKGWYDAATDGNKIGDASDSYSPTDNITLYAQFDAIVPVKDLVRDGLSNGKWGTLCPKQTVENVEGATFYQISYLEEKAGMPFNMVWDAISGTTLEAGKPYFFIANATEIRGNKTGAELDAAGAAVNGFYGWISPTDDKKPLSWRVDYDPTGDNTFVIYNNEVLRLNADGTELRSERCYININATEPSRTPSAGMPGRDRIRMSIAGVSVVTGMDALDASDKPVKMMIDGNLYILRGEKMYDATGRQVK